MRIHAHALTLLAPALVVPAALAQPSNIVDGDKFSWSENCGWMNWRDAGSPTSSQGVLVADTILSSFIWCENIGWINLGDGSPANGIAYANTAGDDFGVNVGLDGALTGLAWGENVGWLNFTLPETPQAQRPRLDDAGRRLRGYVWGVNIGWVNLDSGEPGKFVGVRICPADFNGDGILDPDDLSDYIGCFFALPPCEDADGNRDGTVDPDDLSDFIGAYFTGCP